MQDSELTLGFLLSPVLLGWYKYSNQTRMWIKTTNELAQYVCGMNAICREHCTSLEQTRIPSLQHCACPLFAWHKATHCSQDVASKFFQRCQRCLCLMYSVAQVTVAIMKCCRSILNDVAYRGIKLNSASSASKNRMICYQRAGDSSHIGFGSLDILPV